MLLSARRTPPPRREGGHPALGGGGPQWARVALVRVSEPLCRTPETTTGQSIHASAAQTAAQAFAGTLARVYGTPPGKSINTNPKGTLLASVFYPDLQSLVGYSDGWRVTGTLLLRDPPLIAILKEAGP